MRKTVIFFVALLMFSDNLFAVDFEKKMNVIGMGLFYGGDNMGGAGSDEINAGEDLLLFYGRILPVNRTTQYQLNIGFKDDMVEARNGELWFYRIPLEALFLKRINQYRIGGGLTYHINTTYESELNGVKNVIKFDNALGFVIQAEATHSNFISAGLRYENITYSPPAPIFNPRTGQVMNKVDGSSIGFFAGFHF